MKILLATLALALIFAPLSFAQDKPAANDGNSPRIKSVDIALEKADAEAVKACLLARIKARQKALMELAVAKKAAFTRNGKT